MAFRSIIMRMTQAAPHEGRRDGYHDWFKSGPMAEDRAAP